jgi:hypothetical protein
MRMRHLLAQSLDGVLVAALRFLNPAERCKAPPRPAPRMPDSEDCDDAVLRKGPIKGPLARCGFPNKKETGGFRQTASVLPHTHAQD